MESEQQNDPDPAATHESGYGVWVFALLLCVALMAFVLGRNPDSPPAPVSPDYPDGTLVESNVLTTPPDPLTALIESHTPQEQPVEGYVGSEACLECHEGQHESWFHSHHRMMTQKATPEAVIPDIDDLIITHGSTNPAVRLYREADRYWVEFRNPDGSPRTTNGKPPRQPIVMTTGSHHQQLYWLPTGRGRSLLNVPYLYLIETKEWIPLGSNFVQPPGEGAKLIETKWNSDCLRCHATHSRSREIEEGNIYDTMVGEFGISCESCHGPGAPHIAHHRNKITGTPDPVVNPHGMDHRLSSQVCGACHSLNVHRVGIPMEDFRPGQNLHAIRQVLRFDEEGRKALRATTTDTNSVEKAIAKMSRMFWRDGHPRVTGREYQALMQTTCHTRGEMSCVSCHRLHRPKSDKRAPKEWADDQLDHRRLGDAACHQCHETSKYQTTQHTHHALDSVGSSCMNCHMPHTSYGLLKAIRTHGINSPHIGRDRNLGRPNACNLCHLDRSLEWAAEELNQWFGQPLPQLDKDERQLAAGALWAIKGDAGVRALAAWHMGWQPTRQTVGDDWSAIYLSLLMKDPYDAVRYLARRSVWKLPGHEQLKFNFLGPGEEQQRVSAEVPARWEKEKGAMFRGKDRSDLLITLEGKLDRPRLETMLKERDHTEIYLLE